VAARKRRSGKNKKPRQGISGNPQRRAVQLAQRRSAATDGPDLPPLVMDFRSGKPENSGLQEIAYAFAGGAEPRPWWSESHENIIASALSLDWPSRPVDVETQACRIVGEEFYERLNSAVTGLHPAQWLVSLIEKTGAALIAAIQHGGGDWQQLWALVSGLALTVPPGDTRSETAKLARERFPDIRDPYETALAEVGKAAKLLANRGLASGYPADGCQPAGTSLAARDVYGSRALLVAPFAYGQDQGEDVPDHWYAWDIDRCWTDTVVGAWVAGSAAAALREWQDAVGPAASGATLSPSTPGMTAQLLGRCLDTGPLSQMLEGSEPRELIHEYYRLRRRARVLVASSSIGAASSDAFDADDAGQVREAFLAWYAAQHDGGSKDAAEAADTILYEWGPRKLPDESWFYACSPHRIEMTAHLIRDGYIADYANAALRLLPEWTQWCIERSGLTGDFAARSRDTAVAEAAALVDEEAGEGPDEREDEPFRRHE
jgi:hypothetical protein